MARSTSSLRSSSTRTSSVVRRRSVWHSRQQSASVRRTAGLPGFPACPAAARAGQPTGLCRGPLLRRRARPRLGPPAPADAPGGRRAGPGRGGRRDRVLRRGGAHREDDRRAHRDPGGPARAAPGVPAGARVPARRRAGRPWSGRSSRRRPPPARRTASGSVAVPRQRRPGSPAAAGSTSRASTTPSWSRRSGATTCGSRASWSSTWAASTTCPPWSASSPPTRDRRLGVLVDHLVAGSKESRIAAQVVSPHVLVVGHPYVDVWQAVRPAALGIAAWPEVPRGTPWKEGVCAGLGWPVGPARGLAADPRRRPDVRRPGAEPARPGGGAHRFRHAR